MCDTDTREQWICSCCIEEPFLQRQIEEQGSREECHYCGDVGACFTLEEVSNRTEKAIKQHFTRTPVDPTDLEYVMIKHADLDWERTGDEIQYVIEGLLQTRSEAASDIQQLLEERYSDFDSDLIGMETEFASGSHYVEDRQVDTCHLDSLWNKFVTSLKTESRYVNKSIMETLDGIFSGIETMRAGTGKEMIMEVGPGTSVPYLYRARWGRSHDEIEKMLVMPDVEIGPPPHLLSGSNRMSAKGISVFYGSNSAETAIPEIRPPVGCTVVSARFQLLRPMRLLNLPTFESVWQSGSMFDPHFINKLAQAAFLRTLTSRIANPVLPGEEDFSYIPTQVIAEYLADTPRLALDGILYPSVQESGNHSSENYNVVLFHKASRVRYLTLPDKKHCRISYGHQYAEDDWEPDICVTQTKEVDERSITSEQNGEAGWKKDNRQYSLEIELSSVCVHDIRAVHFDFSTEAVRRDKLILEGSKIEFAGDDQAPWAEDDDQDDVPY